MSAKHYQQRRVIQRYPAVLTSDGEGVNIRRSIAQLAAGALDPFIMLDEFYHDAADGPVSGFPSHPHRGFETVTYMLEGSMFHRDNLGNSGEIFTGGVQWMTAGSGVVHSETPKLSSKGRVHGFQLWVNLPAISKMAAPTYQEFSANSLPRQPINAHSSSATVIAGQLNLDGKSFKGPIQQAASNVDYADIQLNNDTVRIKTSNQKRLLLYVYKGNIKIGDEPVSSHTMAVMGNGDILELAATEHAGILLLAGTPLNEPVVQWGPFVMNTRDEIEQAIRDFRDNKFAKNG